MLLRRLADFAARDDTAKPFHRSRLLSWRLDLDAQGRPLSTHLQPLVPAEATGRRATGVAHVVPAVVRTAGVAANLAADDVQYVFGWADEDSKPERVAQCLQAFSDLTRQWAGSDAGVHDPVAQALAAFYTSGALATIERPPECTAKQGVLITVAGQPVHQADSVVDFWSAEVARRKGGGKTGICLVCGKIAPLLDTVPGKVPSRLVPGATNDAALVSVNERVFGYDLTTQLACSPVCFSCGEAASAGLVGVLSSAHSTAYGGQDSRMAWWVTGTEPFDVMRLLEQPDPDQVTTLLNSVRTGAHQPMVDGEKFCSLTVGGNIARVMVRDWVEMPLDQVETNLAHWFTDLEVVPLWPDGRRRHGIGLLTLATGRWQRDRNRYADFGAKGADRPEGVHRDLLRVAVFGHVLPPSLLIHLIHRISTDGHLDDPRAALLRLALLRSPTATEKPMPGLDTTNTTPAYVAGRAFAALEALQYDASGGALNTTYADRYFPGAISNPRAALLHGRKSANAWLRKLRRSKKGAAVNHEKTLDELFNLITVETGLPARTTPAQQALFMLGYHHQRAHRMAAITAAKAKNSEEHSA
ncbi:type I-C CRISPR-associated protein Cas8c/Csd1 [Amycolatopsis japonica]